VKLRAVKSNRGAAGSHGTATDWTSICGVTVSQIPTVVFFLKTLDRTGRSRLTKKHVDTVVEILNALGDAESYRGEESDPAILRLRRIRKACAKCKADKLMKMPVTPARKPPVLP